MTGTRVRDPDVKLVARSSSSLPEAWASKSVVCDVPPAAGLLVAAGSGAAASVTESPR
jgi:hypothetical protein